MSEITSRLSSALADRYRLEHRLGEGGMATVYLAHDIKHDRKVAIKVLRPELAAVLGAERFVQEIKTTASLQHPHILPLFDSGEADGFLYYVMPYIEGETLRDKLDRETQLGVDEAVRLTCEVAGALDYAHRQGVIHRDIKPENILLHDGRPMVADFGIALAVSAAAGGRMTETGLSLGTPHYMSPEQATAEKQLTGRSDIYSLGAVLYEMLTGDPPHTGSSAQQIIMKIVTDEARPVTELRKAVPPNVAAAVARALEKLPADRFESVKGFAAALTDATFASASADGAAGRISGHATTGSRAWPLVALVALALGVYGWLRPGPDLVVTSQRIVLGPDAPDPGPAVGQRTAIAPDGSAIVFSDARGLWLKARDAARPMPLEGGEAGHHPAFSPDGESIAFFRDGGLHKVSRQGGAAIQLADSASDAFGAAAWLDDGRVAYTNAEFNIAVVDASGGRRPEVLVEATAFTQESRAPLALNALPASRGLLVVTCSVLCEQAELFVVGMDDPTPTLLVEDAVGGWYAETGDLVYVRRDGAVFAVPFDLRRLETHGASTPVMVGVAVSGTRLADFELCACGDLLYVTGAASGLTRYELVWVDGGAAPTPLDSTWRFTGSPLGGFALSPDGSRLAVGLQVDGRAEVWVRELAEGLMVRVASDGIASARPAWSQDGAFLTFVHDHDGAGGYDVYERPVDGSGPERVLVDISESVFQAARVPNGAGVVYRPLVAESRRDIRLRRDDGSDAVIVSDGPTSMSPAISPDGRWLAYVSDETGRREVYVRPLEEPARRRWPVSREGASAPKWSPDGSRLSFIRSDDRLVSVDVSSAGDDLMLGARHVLFDVASFARPNADIPYYDVGHDGRFLFLRAVDAPADAGVRELVYVEHWTEGLKRFDE